MLKALKQNKLGMPIVIPRSSNIPPICYCKCRVLDPTFVCFQLFSQPSTNHSTTTDSNVLFLQNAVGAFEWETGGKQNQKSKTVPELKTWVKEHWGLPSLASTSPQVVLAQQYFLVKAL